MAYARYLKTQVPLADLVAACSIDPAERAEATDILAIPSVYEAYEDLLSHPGLEVMFVISSTLLHAEHIQKALRAGLHVFSEKPLAIDLDTCQQVIHTAQLYPALKVMVGFVRRFDESYQYAYDKIQSGAIGTPYMIRSQTVDIDRVSDFQIKYTLSSGGIFHDYNVHDIDLTRWLMNDQISSVYAMGGAYKYEGFAAMGDADNVLTTCQLGRGGMATFSASRTATHGHDTFTEITGTEGTLRIGRPPSLHRVEISDRYGVRTECLETYWDRFHHAFLRMIIYFLDCVDQDITPRPDLYDATEATKVAIACTSSFRLKTIVDVT